MNLYYKKDRREELTRLIKLMNDFAYSEDSLIDLSGINILNKLKEKEIEVDEVKQNLNEALLSEKEFYQELNKLIEELEDISDFGSVKQEEEIEELLNILNEFKDNIMDFEDAIRYKDYGEYFFRRTFKLVKELSYIDKKIEDEYLIDIEKKNI